MSSTKFSSIEELCKELEGTTPIRRVLVANNGLAAVKGITSIRNWLYDHINDPSVIHITVLASPEDLKVNAEFIRLADQHIEVPGGRNSNNYSNVDLIVNTAVQNSCDAVYPGWGHASENPALPRQCDQSGTITFLGPSEGPMFALGDKIASTIIAQSNAVPIVAWSGDSIRLPCNTFNIPDDMYRQSQINTCEMCEEVCERIGFPVMIKASEGGGGKGIRKVTSSQEVIDAYNAVTEEVKDSPVFCMKMLENVRHLEVQLLGDKYGNCIAVRTRDCSVQRRHQKIIEEGPVSGVDPTIILEMEASAVRLAKSVGYSGLGTVEYMYDKNTCSFFFLELNPRIQVEHPVSELISGVNLPAALLCVGMGIPLHRIPEVRSFYGEDPYGSSPIDFENRRVPECRNHTIAVRITAEDADEGFRPTTGTIDEISFSNGKEVWGYFSVPSGGAVHQFADSQFGHIFSTSSTREQARRGMVFALRNTIIRGEIRTSHAFIVELLERQEFRECDVSTAWLDRLISTRSRETYHTTSDLFPSLCAAAIFRMKSKVTQNIEEYCSSLRGGHTPPQDLLINRQQVTFVLRSDKFLVDISKTSPGEYALRLGGSLIVVPCRECGFGLQMTISNRTIVAYCEEGPTSLRVTISGKATTFTGDVDATKLQSSVPGRLVRFLVPDGGHVDENRAFAEVEVMKMILPLTSSVSGTIHIRVTPGSTIAVGKVLAEVDPDDPSRMFCPVERKDPWPAWMKNSSHLLATGFEGIDGLSRARAAIDTLWNLIRGYDYVDVSVCTSVQVALEGLKSICLDSVTFESLASTREYLTPYICANSPNEKMRSIIECLVSNFLIVEQPFDNVKRSCAISKLKTNNEESLKNVYYIDFAHHKEHRLEVVLALLGEIEMNRRLMVSCKGLLDKIGALKSTQQYGTVLMQARYLLRQCAFQSFEERKSALLTALESGDINTLLQGSYGYDLMCSILFDSRCNSIAQPTLLLFLRRSFFGVATIGDVDIWLHQGSLFGRYSFAQNSEEVSSLYPKKGCGFIAQFIDEVEMEKRFNLLLTDATKRQDHCMITLFFGVRVVTTQDEMSQKCTQFIKSFINVILNSNFEIITFIVHGAKNGPHIFLYTRSLEFSEDTLHRNLIPTTARYLELERLQNYNLSMFATPHTQVHVFTAVPKKCKSLFVETRIFIRIFLTPHDLGIPPGSCLTSEETANIFNMTIAAAEFARSDKKLSNTVYNHLFFNLIELSFDVKTMYINFKRLEATFSRKLFSMGFREVELKFKVNTPIGPLSYRVFISNPTGYTASVRCYVEDVVDGEVILYRAEYQDDFSNLTTILESGGKGDQLDKVPSVQLHERMAAIREFMPVRDGVIDANASMPTLRLESYPHMSSKHVQRLSAQVMGTTFVHDWMILLDISIRKQWRNMQISRGLGRNIMPTYPLIFKTMTVEGGRLVYGDPKQNVGIVVWEVEYTPPSSFDLNTCKASSRKVIFVANDITCLSGSFSVPEDEIFAAASAFARDFGLPFIYISANSGARLGLVNEVKNVFKIAMKGESLEYLYLTETDYIALNSAGVVVDCERIATEDGEVRFKIKAIVGSKCDYVGVENLQGSALIAGQMSLNYSVIPTISIVSGRTVGIGAYLVRLGRRVIQANGAPIILTGNVALNRLLGKEVYVDNMQLGGADIMGPNGVAHFEVENDLQAVISTLKWLDFVPVVSGKSIIRRPRTNITSDPIDRPVTFFPERSVPYDPRLLVTGDGNFSGMFDKESWMETMERWAPTVVCGRATLGGIPCGIILVETRTIKRFNPADPADPSSVSSVTPQAGQVWFPDSARKTADSLEDFQKESLPCFILANWRGFSGGMRDMYDQVLKFGASIVDNLRTYAFPVFIYIPPFGELRGGAWVVVDPVINHCVAVESYCDGSSRGGILEPAGVVEIKYRENDIRDLIRRTDKIVQELQETDPNEAKKRETSLLPTYNDIAIQFADLHDTPGRMKAKGCVTDVVPWEDSRRIFHKKLQRKMKEMQLVKDLISGGVAKSPIDGYEILSAAFKSVYPNNVLTDDEVAMNYFSSSEAADAISLLLGTACANKLEELLKDKEMLQMAFSVDPSLKDSLLSLCNFSP